MRHPVGFHSRHADAVDNKFPKMSERSKRSGTANSKQNCAVVVGDLSALVVVVVVVVSVVFISI